MADLKLGLGNFKFRTDERWLEYKTLFTNYNRILKSDIESVTVTDAKGGNCKLQIVGKGTVLANLKMPVTWANKAQDFILNEVGVL